MENEDFLTEDEICDEVIGSPMLRTWTRLRMNLRAGLRIKEVHNEECRRNQKKYYFFQQIE